jgi:hypothetical protein
VTKLAHLPQFWARDSNASWLHRCSHAVTFAYCPPRANTGGAYVGRLARPPGCDDLNPPVGKLRRDPDRRRSAPGRRRRFGEGESGITLDTAGRVTASGVTTVPGRSQVSASSAVDLVELLEPRARHNLHTRGGPVTGLLHVVPAHVGRRRSASCNRRRPAGVERNPDTGPGRLGTFPDGARHRRGACCFSR